MSLPVGEGSLAGQELGSEEKSNRGSPLMESSMGNGEPSLCVRHGLIPHGDGLSPHTASR